MTINAVKNILSQANEAANDYTLQLVAYGKSIKQIDRDSGAICMALMHSQIEPDHRVAMAQELVDLQSDRREIVNKIIEATKE
jgi:hypothetical protein